MDKMREGFEEWCKVNELRLERQRTMLGGDMGRYEFPPTQFSWEIWVEAWQASREALVVELPVAFPVCDDRDSAEVAYVLDILENLALAGVSYK